MKDRSYVGENFGIWFTPGMSLWALPQLQGRALYFNFGPIMVRLGNIGGTPI
jgi:hypothetical protein